MPKAVAGPWEGAKFDVGPARLWSPHALREDHPRASTSTREASVGPFRGADDDKMPVELFPKDPSTEWQVEVSLDTAEAFAESKREVIVAKVPVQHHVPPRVLGIRDGNSTGPNPLDDEAIVVAPSHPKRGTVSSALLFDFVDHGVLAPVAVQEPLVPKQGVDNGKPRGSAMRTELQQSSLGTCTP